MTSHGRRGISHRPNSTVGSTAYSGLELKKYEWSQLLVIYEENPPESPHNSQ